MSMRMNHVGIAVETLEHALPFWAEALGLEVRGIETVEAERVKIAWLAAGEACIELLEPTSADSPVRRYLERHPRGGIHHLTLEVDDLALALERLAARGVQVLGPAPRLGAHGRPIAFLHPQSTGGVLLELVERAPRAARGESELGPGSPVLLYLREPQERMWGVLRLLDATGVVLEGIDLASFDDWVAQVEREDPSIIGPSVLFLPMLRLEKVLLDRTTGELPSLADRFKRRTGRTVLDVLDERH